MSIEPVSEKDSSRWPLFAFVAGLVVFSLLVDPSILNPLNVDWLANGDPAQSYLGWLFFRQEPWTLPLGLAYKLGMEQASSIVYSDSIPLLAIPFKLFQAWLPANFQYDGMWLFGCYALQGYFACRLLMLFTARGSVLIVGVLLFLLSPVLLFRVPVHFALTAQWIVVAAIYLYYAPPHRRRLLQWLALLWLAPLVHAYLMFMAYAVWAAYVLRYGVLDRQWRVAHLLAWIVAAVAGSLAMMWLAGYFRDMDVSIGGFGFYSMNLLSPVRPVGAGTFLMQGSGAATAGQYEGFNYLGLGVLLALAVALAGVFHRRRSIALMTRSSTSELPLVLCCLVLAALAVSNVVTLGSHQLFTIALPVRIEAVLDIFRASGRLFWPVYYALLLAAMRGAAKLSGPLCARLLLVVLALQLADLWPFLHAIHRVSIDGASQYHFPVFSSPFWQQARARYANIYVLPGVYKDDNNIAYESLAGAHGFAIDSAYYARLPSAKHQQSRQQRHERFFEGALDPHGLYLIQRKAWKRFSSMQRLLPPMTGVGWVDGFMVVAPDWFAHAGSGSLQRPLRPQFPEASLAQEIRFGADDPGALYALAGWSEPGDHAVWSVDTSAMLAFHVASAPDDLKIALEVMPYLPAAHPELRVKVRMDGRLLADWKFGRGKPAPDTGLTIPAALRTASDGNIALSFSFDQPRSPLESGESVDARKLALLLRGMRLQPH
jgi:hypothetical protein